MINGRSELLSPLSICAIYLLNYFKLETKPKIEKIGVVLKKILKDCAQVLHVS